MASSPGWDRNGNANVNDFSQQSRGSADKTGSTGSTTRGTSSSNKETSTRQVQSSFTQNMTPQSLAALEALIFQLSDQPAISQAALDVKAPLPTARFDPGARGPTRNGIPSRGVWIWTDPLTGRSLNKAQADKLTTEREAQRAQLTAEAGVIPGGTAQTRADAVLRNQTAKNISDSVGDFSKEDARADTESVVNQIIRRVQEGEISSLTRSAEGAGTSQSAIRALLTNDLSARAGEAGGVAAGQIAAQYGNTQANLSNSLTSLLQLNPALDALLQALGISKGAVQSNVSVNNVNSVETATGQTDQTTDQTQTENTVNAADVVREANTPQVGQVSYVPSADLATDDARRAYARRGPITAAPIVVRSTF